MKIRRLLAIVLVLVICVGTAFAEENYFNLTANGMKQLTEATGYSAADWISNEENRCYLTSVSMLDWLMDQPSKDTSQVKWAETTYIGKKGLDLIMVFETVINSKASSIVIVYRPITGECGYMPMEGNKPSAYEKYFTEYCSDGFYKNDAETMYKCISEIVEALQANG